MRAPLTVTCPHCGKLTRSPRWSSLRLIAYCAGCHKTMPITEEG